MIVFGRRNCWPSLLAHASGLVLLCVVTAAQAAPLAAYRERVRKAADTLADLSHALAPGDEDDVENAAERPSERDAAALLQRGVRESLPASERVEWDGGALEVDNRWLQQSLDEYEKMSGATEREKAAALSQISERLRALDEWVAEAANAPKMARDKEAEKGRLQSILRRAEYQQDAAEGGALKRWWGRFWKWLSGLLPEAQPLQPGTARGVSTIGRYFVYALGLAIIAASLWFYGPRVLRRNVSHRERQRREARVVLGERLAPEQTGADLLAEAEALAHKGNWRAAVRKAYLAVLCELGERRIIRLAQHKTNRDYLRAIKRERAALYADMQPLTTSYERLWYGLAAADETDWADFRAGCLKAVTSDE